MTGRMSEDRSPEEQESLASYAAACLSIYLKAYDRALLLPLRGVEAVLCEDGITVMLSVPAGDEWIMASFELPAKIEEKNFAPAKYIEGFELGSDR